MGLILGILGVLVLELSEGMYIVEDVVGRGRLLRNREEEMEYGLQDV